MKNFLPAVWPLATVALSTFSLRAADGPATVRLAYPPTKKVDVVDNYFGTKVADPYRWLEDDKSPEVEAWVEAQNKVTFGYLDQIPYRAQLKARLMKLYNYPKYTAPTRRGEWFIFSKNEGLQNQNVYYIQKGLEGAPEGLCPSQIGPLMARVSHVREVHDLHVWELTPGQPILTAHVLVAHGADCHGIRRELEKLLRDRFHVNHTTLQVDHIAPELLSIQKGDKRAADGGKV